MSEAATPHGYLGCFEERNQRASAYSDTGEIVPYAIRHAWADNQDGTWYVVDLNHKGEQWGNREYLPTELEAREYAQALAAGCLHVGAMMHVHELRIRRAREAKDEAPCDRCALCEKPAPRYYCWAGKPEDRGEGKCPLGMPPRWELQNY